MVSNRHGSVMSNCQQDKKKRLHKEVHLNLGKEPYKIFIIYSGAQLNELMRHVIYRSIGMFVF